MVRRGGRSRSEGASEPEIAELAARLGIPQDQTAWLEHALTHRSFTRERDEEARESNERLEFLGDAVVQLAVSILLYERYPRWSEGELTRARAAVVSREPMLKAALRLGLGRYIRLGKTEENLGGRERPSILSTCFEAVVAAVYLTLGMEAASGFIESSLDEELEAVQSVGARTDFKTQLQEVCQAQRHITPVYRLIETAGPAHEREFTAEVLIESERRGSGTGRSRKDAEQAAAREALKTVLPGRPHRRKL